MAEEFIGWYRAGRGRSMQFYATDDEIAESLVGSLRDDYAPYVVLREEWSPPRLVAHEYALEDITTSFGRTEPTSRWSIAFAMR